MCMASVDPKVTLSFSSSSSSINGSRFIGGTPYWSFLDKGACFPLESILSRQKLGAFRQQVLDDREEYAKIGLLFLYLFCAASASTIGRTAADTLFLSHFSPSQLSMMYLPQSLTLLLAGVLYQKVCKQVRIDQLCTFITLGTAGLSLGTRMLAELGYNELFMVTYVAYDLFNFLMIVSFWQFATSVMDQRKAKKLINWVGSGTLVGGIVSGFGLKWLVQPLGTLNLILVYSSLQLVCFILVRVLISRVTDRRGTFAIGASPSKAKQTKGGGKPSAAQAGKDGLIQQVPHLKYLAVIALTITISLTYADYQFKLILRGSLQDEALAGFMGSFYGFAGILALAVQLFLTGKVISSYGVRTSLLLLPAALLAGSAGLLAAPIVALAIVLKGSDKVFGDTIYSSVSQLVMFPIPPEYRARAKGFLDGTVRNGAKSIAGISLILLSPLLSVQQFSVIVIVLLLICGAAAIRIKQAYLKMLMATLRTRDEELLDADWNLMDSGSVKALTDTLQSNDKLQVLYALRLLQSLNGFDLAPYVPQLLQHPVTEVRVEALKWVQVRTPEGRMPDLERFLAAEHQTERAQALLALAAYAQDSQLERVTAFLDDPHIEARAAAIVGLIKYYGVEGMFHAVGPMKALIGSERVEERIAVATLFGQIGIPSFYKPLIPLLTDRSVQVRERALHSASQLRVPELIPHLVPLLGHSTTREGAIGALAGYEEKHIVAILEPMMTGGDASRHLSRVFERMGSQRAFDVLLRHYGRLEGDLRTPLLEAMTRMRKTGRYAAAAAVEPLITEEAEMFRMLDENGRFLESAGEAYTETADAVRRLKQAAANRVFGLLALIYEPPVIEAVQANWASGEMRRQANAAEVIEQVLQGELRNTMAQFMTRAYSSAALSAGSKAPDIRLIHSRLVTLRLLKHGDSWLQLCVDAALAADTGRPPVLEQVKLLRQVTLFRGMWGKDLAALARQLVAVDAVAGETIIHEGEEGDSLFLVIEGKAGVFRGEARIGRVQTGDCFGEMAVLTSGLRTATIEAESDMRLWRLDSDVFYEIMFDQTNIALEMMRLLSERLRGSNARAVRQQTEMGPAFAERQTAAAVAAESGPGTAALAAAAAVDNQTLLRRMLVLQKITLFAHFSQDDYVRLARVVEEVHYEAGEIIFRADEPGDSMHGIIEGTVRIHRGDVTFAMLGEGELFGEMSILDNQPRSADCTATEPTLLLRLTRETTLSFCFQRLDVMKGMLRFLAERLRTMQQQG